MKRRRNEHGERMKEKKELKEEGEEEEAEEEEEETEISKALARDFRIKAQCCAKGHSGMLTWAGILPPFVS